METPPSPWKRHYHHGNAAITMETPLLIETSCGLRVVRYYGLANTFDSRKANTYRWSYIYSSAFPNESFLPRIQFVYHVIAFSNDQINLNTVVCAELFFLLFFLFFLLELFSLQYRARVDSSIYSLFIVISWESKLSLTSDKSNNRPCLAGGSVV